MSKETTGKKRTRRKTPIQVVPETPAAEPESNSAEQSVTEQPPTENADQSAGADTSTEAVQAKEEQAKEEQAPPTDEKPSQKTDDEMRAERDARGLAAAQQFMKDHGIVANESMKCTRCGHHHGEILSKVETNDRLYKLIGVTKNSILRGKSIAQKRGSYCEVVGVDYHFRPAGKLTRTSMDQESCCRYCKDYLFALAEKEGEKITIFSKAKTLQWIEDQEMQERKRETADRDQSLLTRAGRRNNDRLGTHDRRTGTNG